MKNFLYLVALALLFSNCSHKIVRTGYQVSKADYKACNVIIKKDTVINDTNVTKLGEIKLGDTGFSMVCNEPQAIAILKNEACALGADLVVITEEQRPNIASSCYRCTAVFYKFNQESAVVAVKTDENYNQENIVQRASADRAKNTAILVGSAVAGFIVGFLLFM